jgi:hypothetical protein
VLKTARVPADVDFEVARCTCRGRSKAPIPLSNAEPEMGVDNAPGSGALEVQEILGRRAL